MIGLVIACSFPFNEPFPVEPEPRDVWAPEVQVDRWAIERWPESSTCEPGGVLLVHALGSDPFDGAVGFELDIIDGNLDVLFEANIEGPIGPSADPGFGTALRIHFAQGQPRIEATIAVRAVDPAGNRSEPVTVDVSEPGESGGCAAGGGADLGAVALLGGALAIARRRRTMRA